MDEQCKHEWTGPANDQHCAVCGIQRWEHAWRMDMADKQAVIDGLRRDVATLTRELALCRRLNAEAHEQNES